MTVNIPQIVVKAGNAEALVAQLRSLTDAERAEWAAVMRKSLPVWRKAVQWWTLDRDEIPKISDPTRRKLLNQAVDAFDRHHRTSGRLLLVAVALDATPAQLVKLAPREGFTMLEREEATEHLADLMIERGTEWVEETMAGLLAQSSVAMAASSLISRLVVRLDLPVPHVAAHLGVWFGTMPAPGTRWQDHFLAACATPDTFWNRPERDKHIAKIREAATKLRRTEPTDDTALLDALLSVIERGERPGPQREALAWIEGLDLDPTTQPERMLGALDVADSQVAAAFTRALLGTELDDEALARIALAVLPRKEKALKRDVLKRLTSIESPSAELMEHVADLSRSTDTTTAKLASTLCDSWGSAPTPDSGTRGLWQEPSLPDPEPFPGLEQLVLDDPALAGLIAEIEKGWDEDANLSERALAQLVATAHARGPEVVVAACRDDQFSPSPPDGYLTRPLFRLGAGVIIPCTEPIPAHSPEEGPALLAERRAHDVLHRIGELPVLLSTPSTNRWEVTAADLRARIERYRRDGIALEPADLAVALGRCDRDRCDELADIDAPIRGLNDGFASIFTVWRDAAVEPPTFIVEDVPAWQMKPIFTVQGDEPWWHEVLEVPSGEYCIPEYLIPTHLARPVSKVFNDIARSGPAAALRRLPDCLAVARRFDEPLAVATLAAAGAILVKDRTTLAAELLQAWDEGRLIPDDLLTAWHSPLWTRLWSETARLGIERSDAKVAALLALIAEAGGLALAWPLLTEIAEELAAANKVPATASTIFETVLALLPEVPHKVELPNICALAARKGSSKAITTARLIKDQL